MLKLNEHENNLNELTQLLNVEGVDQAKVSLIIQGLRDNYTEVDTTITDTTKAITEKDQLMEGLRSANMTLLSKLGSQFADLDTKNKDDIKNKNNQNNNQQEQPKSLDDIANELLK